MGSGARIEMAEIALAYPGCSILVLHRHCPKLEQGELSPTPSRKTCDNKGFRCGLAR